VVRIKMYSHALIGASNVSITCVCHEIPGQYYIETGKVVNLPLAISTRGIDFMYHVMNFLNFNGAL
jgi:hypothetical protein